jgi:hypothetical protein
LENPTPKIFLLNPPVWASFRPVNFADFSRRAFHGASALHNAVYNAVRKICAQSAHAVRNAVRTLRARRAQNMRKTRARRAHRFAQTPCATWGVGEGGVKNPAARNALCRACARLVQGLCRTCARRVQRLVQTPCATSPPGGHPPMFLSRRAAERLPLSLVEACGQPRLHPRLEVFGVF